MLGLDTIPIDQAEKCLEEFWCAKSGGSRAFVALHDDPYPRTNTFIDQLCQEVVSPKVHGSGRDSRKRCRLYLAGEVEKP